ncbi:MAG: hypothetical protein CVT92_07485 [Bacteroidetes bacterium HGW-Bacteroidetes-1]|jgi:molybdopterin-containing oxidoreductase family iron-sulfur binding subunit|nr:MAG: hypothetical protein CVT92_07485 [Bacteroidetes bacterium HGW-Bacteroidetes-1]
MENKYFKSLDELTIDTTREIETTQAGDKGFILESQNEVKSIATASRRDFLKAFGFTIASAAIASSCEQPVRKAIPFLIQPEGLIPGKAAYYASSFFDGIDYCSVLVKVRDGRPIKIEGNTLSSVTRGGTSARVQASVLGLYDNGRHKTPLLKGEETTWDQVDEKIIQKLTSIKDKQGKVVILSSTIISPTTKAAIAAFMDAYPGTDHVQYDVLSASGILKANETSFGKAFVPSYRFDKANLIVAFDADFMGSWLSPIEFTKQYMQNRKLTNGQRAMSRHIHFEGAMSLTGSNADNRVQIKPSQQKLVLANLLHELRKIEGGETSASIPASPVDIVSLASDLLKNKERSLVISGSNDTQEQLLVNAINQLLGNYGSTIETDIHLKLRQATDEKMDALVEQMNAGEVDGLIIYDVNPVYDYNKKDRFIEGLKKVDLTVAMPVFDEETSAFVEFVCPDHHYLEAWNDAEIKTGFYSLAQPAIRPIFKTRAAQESLLRWTGNSADYHQYLMSFWETQIFPKAVNELFFTAFWNTKLHDGVFESGEKEDSGLEFTQDPSNEVLVNLKETDNPSAIEMVFYTNVSVGTGKHANNPWLQELPDPVTKACWDNYIAISPRLAQELNINDEQLVSVNGLPALPVLIQPGQQYKTLSVALGYGREKGGVPANGVGKNMFPLLTTNNGNKTYWIGDVNIEVVEGTYAVARTQSHHSMEGRALVRDTSLEAYLENPESGNEVRKEIKAHLKSLYPKAEFDGFHWGMAIDLNSCTGCNACVVACSAENNVPVVGKEQVINSREMHWIRIDRYYKGDPEDPELVRQPVMCQHCDNAPCENVCPVAATTHSNEGLNQMAYNRCIGTRYCNNNCPYKVRRFNFFDYTGSDSFKGNRYDPAEMTTDLRRLVLNPDVTVRSKGVIEKCSFCVQRIQEKKLEAKTENRMLKDGDVVPACAQSCPADAIVFGNLNDKNSKVSKYFADERNYHLLEEIHTLPSVGYLTKVKNKTI